MQTSRFQLGLIATLAVGLGFSLTSSQAIGYPAGAAVSLGSNPVLSVGGVVSSETETVLTAPGDQMVVITDVWMTMNHTSCSSELVVISGGVTLAQARLHSYFHEDYSEATNSQPSSIQHSFNSGMPVPAGQTLSIRETGGCGVAYTVSGYYAQP